MSRSYKKNLRIKDKSKGQKKVANQAVRGTKNKLEPLKGGNYKKMYPQYDICDWNYVWPMQDAIDSWYEEEADHYKSCYAWRHE